MPETNRLPLTPAERADLREVVRAYDSMPRQRWRAFEAYCAANERPASLLSFVKYLLACADRSEVPTLTMNRAIEQDETPAFWEARMRWDNDE